MLLLAAPLLALAAPAFAQDVPADEPNPDEEGAPEEGTAAPAPAPAAAPAAEPAGPKQRNFRMEVGFRGRYMDLPDSILDLAYYRNDDDDTIPDRPHVSAYSLGIEFVVKGGAGPSAANGIFYVEYLNPMIEAGYWDDKEEPPDHLDGSWMEPDKLGLVLIGANYAYEIRANSWFSFLFGAGIGGAIKIGELREWQPGEDPADPNGTNNNTEVECGAAGTANAAAYLRKEDCANDGSIETPPALPYIDVNLGPRFSISDRASIRIEGGVHALLPYGGASIGITF